MPTTWRITTMVIIPPVAVINIPTVMRWDTIIGRRQYMHNVNKNIRGNLFLLFLLVLCRVCVAQQKQGKVLRPIPQEIGKVTILGNASLEVTYAFNATDLTDEQTYIDLQVLRAGRSVSKYYSRFLELDDSLCSNFKRKNSSASSIPGLFCQQGRNSNYWSEYQFTEIFSQNGTRTYYVRMPFSIDDSLSSKTYHTRRNVARAHLHIGLKFDG